MLKTILAAVSRVLLFSIWLYVFNNGQFSSVLTLIAYYTLVLMLIVFHTVCNKKKPVLSFPFCLGITRDFIEPLTHIYSCRSCAKLTQFCFQIQ